MKIRDLLVVALGTIIFLSTWWIAVDLTSTIGLQLGGSDDDFSYLLGYLPGWTELIHKLLPGFVVGYLSPVRPALNGAAGAALGALALPLLVPGLGIASALNAIALAGVAGAVTALAGAYLQRTRSEHSFKPTPPRGAA